MQLAVDDFRVAYIKPVGEEIILELRDVIFDDPRLIDAAWFIKYYSF